MSTKNVVDLRVRVSETAGETQFESILLKQYAMEEADFVLQASSWQGSAAPYTQTVSGITGVTTSSEGVVGVSQSATMEQYKQAAKAQIRCTAQGSNSLTMACYGVKPTVDIPCHLTSRYEPLT